MQVTIESLHALIEKEEFWTNGKITVCVLTLANGFDVIGTSGVVDRSLFDKELGEKYAKENAINNLWELEGYRMQCENK